MQRAPVSAATPLSLMELLCRLKTEERAHLAWLSQNSEGAISPAETLSLTGSWGIPEADARPHCVFFIIPLSSLIPHSPAPARSGQVGIAQPVPEFDSTLVWVASNGLREGPCTVSAAPSVSGIAESPQCGSSAKLHHPSPRPLLPALTSKGLSVPVVTLKTPTPTVQGNGTGEVG